MKTKEELLSEACMRASEEFARALDPTPQDLFLLHAARWFADGNGLDPARVVAKLDPANNLVFEVTAAHVGAITVSITLDRGTCGS